MAARTKRIFHDENTRAKIQASQIINRLTKHILTSPTKDDYEASLMDSSQVTAALGLLRKSLPDLSSVEMDAVVDGKVTLIDLLSNGRDSGTGS